MKQGQVLSLLQRKLQWERDRAELRLASLQRQAQAAEDWLESIQLRHRELASLAGAASGAVVDVVVRNQALACIASSEAQVLQVASLQQQLLRDTATVLADCARRAQQLDVLAGLQRRASESEVRTERRRTDRQASLARLARGRVDSAAAQDDAS